MPGRSEEEALGLQVLPGTIELIFAEHAEDQERIDTRKPVSADHPRHIQTSDFPGQVASITGLLQTQRSRIGNTWSS